MQLLFGTSSTTHNNGMSSHVIEKKLRIAVVDSDVGSAICHGYFAGAGGEYPLYWLEVE